MSFKYYIFFSLFSILYAQDELKKKDTEINVIHGLLDKKVNEYNDLVKKSKENPNEKSLKNQLKSLQTDIDGLESTLNKYVKEYNELIKKQHSNQPEKTMLKDKESDTFKKTEDPKKAPPPSHIEISNDPSVLQEQVKQLQDTVEKLMKEVSDLKGKSASKKNTTTADATKKAEETDNHIIEFTSAQAQFNEANKWLEKDKHEDIEKAIVGFEEIVQQYCNQPIALSAYVKIGDAYRKIAKWDFSIKNYDYILDQSNASVSQQAEAYLGKAEAERQKNDRVKACKTLDKLERANIPLSKEQNIRYQELVVACDCASKKDKDMKDDNSKE
ncbi:MAG: hypothetical protein KBD31_02635 [Proteobacteria bacterium]|nr:hypothetical protein [Pseudomonadota bacterium]